MTWSLVSVTEAASVWQYRFAASASSRDREKRNISRPVPKFARQRNASK